MFYSSVKIFFIILITNTLTIYSSSNLEMIIHDLMPLFLTLFIMDVNYTLSQKMGMTLRFPHSLLGFMFYLAIAIQSLLVNKCR